VGASSFGVGILYSWGPLPISRTPFGELFSGFFMGCGIVFLSTYIQLTHIGWITLSSLFPIFSVQFKVLPLIQVFFISIPFAALIAAIMLANNISDYEHDQQNGRLTLPLLIGKEPALQFYRILWFTAFLMIPLIVLLRFSSPALMLVWFCAPTTWKWMNQFLKAPSKELTFPHAPITLLLFGLLFNLSLVLSCFIP